MDIWFYLSRSVYLLIYLPILNNIVLPLHIITSTMVLFLFLLPCGYLSSSFSRSLSLSIYLSICLSLTVVVYILTYMFFVFSVSFNISLFPYCHVDEIFSLFFPILRLRTPILVLYRLPLSVFCLFFVSLFMSDSRAIFSFFFSLSLYQTSFTHTLGGARALRLFSK